MNPSDPERPENPERASLYVAPGPEADYLIRTALQRLTSVEDELRLVQAFLEHGAGIAAYLLLKDTRAGDPEIAQRFQDGYAGAWVSVDALVFELIEALGWVKELDEFATREGIPEGAIEWNPEAFYDRVRDMYDLVELDHRVHAFHR